MQFKTVTAAYVLANLIRQINTVHIVKS